MAATEEHIKSQPKAGEILRELRDKKNLSIQDVASQLRLDPQIIEALEKDDYGSFPADTYIRGYLRNYAKLIGIDGDEIISVYESEAPEPPEIIPDVKHSTQVSSSDKPVKAFTYLITFILVLLLFIWAYQSNFGINRGSKLLPIPTSPNGVTQPATNQGKTTSPVEPKTPVTSPAEVPKEVKEVPAPSPQPAPSITAETPAAGEPATTAATATVTGENTQATDSTDSNGTDNSNNKAMPGPDTLYFKINADCWIEVHDRFGKEVYVNLARTGDEIYLNGFAPFQVKLGNAQGVVLEFNNKPFDPAPYTTRGIAKFTLGKP